MIDNARVCFSQQENLSIEHFIELIGKRVEDCDAWERKLRSQGNLKDTEMMKTKEQMLKSLKRLNEINQRANK